MLFLSLVLRCIPPMVTTFKPISYPPSSPNCHHVGAIRQVPTKATTIPNIETRHTLLTAHNQHGICSADLYRGQQSKTGFPNVSLEGCCCWILPEGPTVAEKGLWSKYAIGIKNGFGIWPQLYSSPNPIRHGPRLQIWGIDPKPQLRFSTLKTYMLVPWLLSLSIPSIKSHRVSLASVVEVVVLNLSRYPIFCKDQRNCKIGVIYHVLS